MNCLADNDQANADAELAARRVPKSIPLPAPGLVATLLHGHANRRKDTTTRRIRKPSSVNGTEKW